MNLKLIIIVGKECRTLHTYFLNIDQIKIQLISFRYQEKSANYKQQKITVLNLKLIVLETFSTA